MKNSSSLTEAPKPLASCHSPAQRRSTLDKFVRTAPRKDNGALAPDDVGTPIAELISESNHFLCCGSAVGSWRNHVIEPVECAPGQRSERRASVPWNVWE